MRDLKGRRQFALTAVVQPTIQSMTVSCVRNGCEQSVCVISFASRAAQDRAVGPAGVQGSVSCVAGGASAGSLANVDQVSAGSKKYEPEQGHTLSCVEACRTPRILDNGVFDCVVDRVDLGAELATECVCEAMQQPLGDGV
jgi:hypothetical protein